MEKQNELGAKESDYNCYSFELEECNNDKKPKDSLFLYFAVITASMSMFGIGTIISWASIFSNPTFETIESNPFGRPLTMFEIFLITSSPCPGTLIGPLIMGLLLDIIGRKNGLTICIGAMIFSYVLIAFFGYVIVYIIARVISGMCIGGIMQALPIFVSEITEDHNRARFGCVMSIFIPLGSMYGYILGSLFSIKISTLLLGAPIFISLALFIAFVPESPVYLASKGNRSEAKISISKYRSKSAREVEIDLEQIENMIRGGSQRGGYKCIFKTRRSRKGFLVALGVSIIPPCSGIYVLMTFFVPTFEKGSVRIPSYGAGILLGVFALKVVTFLITAALIERVGRKPLLLTSSLGAAASSFCFGFYIYLRETDSKMLPSVSSWLPIISLFSFIVFYGLGLGPIPMAMMSEMFPSNIRSAGVSLVVLIVCAITAVVGMLYPIMAVVVGASYCMFALVSVCLLGAAFIYFMVPETKGKSVLEIQRILG